MLRSRFWAMVGEGSLRWGEGLFNPATEPEDTGGVTFTAVRPPDEGAATSSRAQCVCAVELPKRRNSGVPGRCGRELLLQRDEYAHPGGAPSERDGRRRGFDQRADTDCQRKQPAGRR